MKVYEGVREAEDKTTAGECTVFVNNEPLPLEPSLKLRNHSPDGFNLGYGGSGPAQLSLALILDATGDAERAQRLYQGFKEKMIARIPSDQDWLMTDAEIKTFCGEMEDPVAVPDWMTPKQFDAAKKLYNRNADGSENRAAFFARIENYGDYCGLSWCGMFIGIEKDGYTHS